ncbi:MAG: NUDIX hydrolase [Sulfitobacter sp.]|nr:NUDIX hydrolase [Sulfitobacter sp.]
MFEFIKQAWAGVTGPVETPPVRRQVAALCYQDTDQGKRVLLITSRDTGRWIVPKGWPIEGLDGPQSALQEAWEEAGVREADIESEPIGHFEYDKGLEDGESIPIKAQVYLTRVRGLSTDYPEVDERERAWFDPSEAANVVDEPELKELLRSL